MHPSAPRADTLIDARYRSLRDRFGAARPEANGYRSARFFEREQAVVLAALGPLDGPVVDVACGSGLMLLPHAAAPAGVFGLDFNADACQAAKANGLAVVRGDAFRLPFRPGSLAQIVNCQFLGQQTSEGARRFVEEAATALADGGRLVILWRRASSLAHRTAHWLLQRLDRALGRPDFPQFAHPIEEIRGFATAAGLAVEREAVTVPFFLPRMVGARSPAADIIGASNVLVLRKPARA